MEEWERKSLGRYITALVRDNLVLPRERIVELCDKTSPEAAGETIDQLCAIGELKELTPTLVHPERTQDHQKYYVLTARYEREK